MEKFFVSLGDEDFQIEPEDYTISIK